MISVKEIRHKSCIHAYRGFVAIEETETHYLGCFDWNHNFEWLSKDEFEEVPDPYWGCGYEHKWVETNDGSERWEVCSGNMEIISTWPTGKKGNPFYQSARV